MRQKGGPNQQWLSWLCIYPLRASRGAAAAPATTVTPRGWAESHRLSALVQHRQPHSIPSARAAESHLSCHYRRNEARPRVAAGSKPGVRASRVVQRPRARVTAPIDHPGAPSPGRESFLTPLPDSFFTKVGTKDNISDVLTKAVSTEVFNHLVPFLVNNVSF